MSLVEPSIEEHNYAAGVRDAILDSIPEQCRDEIGKACPEALERSYKIGQLACERGIGPDEAADWAWGNIGVCCQESVEIEWVPVEMAPSQHRVLVSV